MLKYKINEHYVGYHYVWCSPVFEGAALGRGALGADQPPSSDPASIYRRLHDDVAGRDRHAQEIDRQKQAMKSTALFLQSKGIIVAETAAMIAETVDVADKWDFRPILYAIPFEPIASRVVLVPPSQRASIEPEYIIPDLKQGEFHMIEPFPCR